MSQGFNQIVSIEDETVTLEMLTITSEVAIGGGAFTRSKLMVFLVAFQNGFFGKGFSSSGGWRRPGRRRPPPTMSSSLA